MAKRLSLSQISAFIKRRIIESKPVQFVVRKAIELRLRPIFNQIRQEMLDEFINHPITEEIAMGPKLNWNSPFLNGKGDLFSFIGFHEGDDPIKPIFDLIKGIRLFSVTSKGLDHKFEIRFFPTRDDIKQITPMPWAKGRSWAIGIEQGISGLGSYLNKEHEASRSTAGIEAKDRSGRLVKVRDDKFENVPYISEILNKYRQKFSDISHLRVLTGAKLKLPE